MWCGERNGEVSKVSALKFFHLKYPPKSKSEVYAKRQEFEDVRRSIHFVVFGR